LNSKTWKFKPGEEEAGKPIDTKSDDVCRQTKYKRSSQNIPLLGGLIGPVLRIKSFPHDSGNENDYKLKKENVHGIRRLEATRNCIGLGGALLNMNKTRTNSKYPIVCYVASSLGGVLRSVRSIVAEICVLAE
jgi:hypothetical protein